MARGGLSSDLAKTVGDRRQRDEAGQEAQLAVGQVVPIEVREDDGGQIERRQRQDAEAREEEEQVAVGDDHRPPVEALELLDQEAGRGHERTGRGRGRQRRQRYAQASWAPLVFPALQTRADYLRLRSLG